MKMDYVEKIKKNKEKSKGFWSPIVGEETRELLKNIQKNYGLDKKSTQKLQKESLDILSRCGNPKKDRNSENGIIIGYIQSGKTMSFTTVASLAKDNGYQIIIIMAGISVLLLNQTTDRLESDLRYITREDREWLLFKEPKKNELHRIKNAIDAWKDKKYPLHKRRVLLITVKKHPSMLQDLNYLFSKIDLNSVPTLIIDDEADQASLNTRAYLKKESEHSTIYSLLKQLKGTFPHHTYLQYTATPQALIFINITDILSPKFVRLLEPGSKYTGAKCFFLDHNYLVVPILGEKKTEDVKDAPPESLLEALRIFLIGAAQGESEFDKGNRSMLIHPSRLTPKHRNYFYWTKQIIKRYKQTLNLSDSAQDKKLLLKEFHSSYKELKKTEKKLSDFKIIKKNLLIAINDTYIEEVNAAGKSTPQIPWRDHYSFILVGGQAMDRGYTVKGLTVTYMPRSKGGSNVDTLLQRSRFFGYKKDYLGYCRVFIPGEIIDRIKKIIEHEEDIRKRLKQNKEILNDLDSFDRKTILHRILRLTRRNVLSDELERYKYGNQWVWTKVPHDSKEIIVNNRKVIKDFIKKHKFFDDKGDPRRTEDQRHLFCKIDLKEVIELLEKLKYTRLSDSEHILNISTIFDVYKDKKEKCLIYQMRKGKERKRKLVGEGEVQNIFQGRNLPTGYPGDKEIKEEDMLTVQIHNLRITKPDEKTLEVDNTYALGIWVPEKFTTDFVRPKNDDK